MSCTSAYLSEFHEDHKVANFLDVAETLVIFVVVKIAWCFEILKKKESNI